MDNGLGTVGSLVVRGGGFQTDASMIRRSYREEVPLFLFRSSDNSYSPRRDRTVGIRLMVGASVRVHEAADTAFKEISSEFAIRTENPCDSKYGANRSTHFFGSCPSQPPQTINAFFPMSAVDLCIVPTRVLSTERFYHRIAA